jgi:hypothetical protein
MQVLIFTFRYVAIFFINQSYFLFPEIPFTYLQYIKPSILSFNSFQSQSTFVLTFRKQKFYSNDSLCFFVKLILTLAYDYILI